MYSPADGLHHWVSEFIHDRGINLFIHSFVHTLLPSFLQKAIISSCFWLSNCSFMMLSCLKKSEPNKTIKYQCFCSPPPPSSFGFNKPLSWSWILAVLPPSVNRHSFLSACRNMGVLLIASSVTWSHCNGFLLKMLQYMRVEVHGSGPGVSEVAWITPANTVFTPI